MLLFGERRSVMNVREKRNEVLGARVVKALESRNMEAYYVKTKEEALEKALELIPEGSSVSWGGTMSAQEIGLTQALKDGEYVVYDRETVGTREEKEEIAHKALNCDFFLGSTNAISEDGVMVNIDGNSNRVAAYAYGPKNVLLIVGMNKVVKTEADAMSRAKNEAAPINAQRFGIDTPCVKNGSCFDCKKPECICCQILITRYSRVAKRTKVILVDENLGF
jgi:L-lactate utilization protein LutC